MEITPSSSPPGRFKLFDHLELLEFNDKYVIKSVESPNRGFSINRLHGDIQPLNNDSGGGGGGESSVRPSKTSVIYGVVGTIRLVVGTYILVIISRTKVGEFLGFPVFRIAAMKFLPCNEALKFSTAQEKRDEAYFMNLLKVVESTPGLYYSYETDITLNLQRRCKLAEGWMSKPIWKSADPRFVWNKSLLYELIEFKLKIKESSATVTLVSRRCTRRLGTRMWRRGANLEGDTANFIETEQLLELEGYRSSLLQIRGSIPILWEQIVDLSYRPSLRIISHEQTSNVVERHFHDLYQRYGDTMAVDLTNKHGDEGQLSTAYAAEMQKLPHVRYVSFDFHHVCGNSNFDNLQILYNQISDDFQKQGYILVDAEGSILEEQKGIIRSNCIDCLDRTNVTQSLLGQKSLTMQLQRIGVLSSIECITMLSEEFRKFRTLWAEQGDEVSLEYAGTHALKGDLVRYGRQTIGGIIKDGLSALSRYYLNNFQDGVRQDALDLISGHYNVNRNGPSPFQLNGFESLSYLPVASAASALLIGGLTITSVTFHQAGRQAQQYLSTVIWAGVTAGVMAVVKANGRQFCSRPRLCGLM
ncbi:PHOSPHATIDYLINOSITIDE PHOSPHATASE SAC1 [Salix koriyanagi]|uniref:PHOSPHATIDYLINOSITIDE PHOSPHATASE SAC1 n=1 Tax=Salix koriyanagi TaxID=2511006 RepID=A0A9Q0X661_9ROSI|nr:PHOSPHATIDYLINOSITIDE PHOSPHATASE SAC1 [Salix koriyanagi]